MRKFAKEFREFVATGNMIELAVAVILGTAVAASIKAFTDGIMMQIVAAIFKKPNFDDVTITLRHDVGKDADGNPVDAVLRIGTFINTLIALVLTALVLFLLIKAYNRMKRKAEAAPAGPSEIDLLVQIRDELRARP